MSNFGRGQYKKHSYRWKAFMILNLDQWKISCIDSIILSSGGHSVMKSITAWAGSVTELLRNICVKLFEFEPAGHIRSRCCLNKFLLSLWLAVVAILFCEVEPFGKFW